MIEKQQVGTVMCDTFHSKIRIFWKIISVRSVFNVDLGQEAICSWVEQCVKAGGGITILKYPQTLRLVLRPYRRLEA